MRDFDGQTVEVPTFTPEHPQYPDVHVQLTGDDGNAFAIIGAVAKSIRRQVGHDAANRYTKAALQSTSWEQLLYHAMSTVDVA